MRWYRRQPVTTFFNITDLFLKEGRKVSLHKRDLSVWRPTLTVLLWAKLATEATEMLWLSKIAEFVQVIINATLGRLTTLASL